MEKVKAKKVLFVCTGNTCRSCMAEALARALAEETALKDIQFSSAGTMAWPGEKASQQAVDALSEQGIELSQHRATLLTPELIENADLILTMTENHRQQILKHIPSAENKVFSLGSFAGNSGDIVDPYGSPVEIYRRCAGELRTLLLASLKKIKPE